MGADSASEGGGTCGAPMLGASDASTECGAHGPDIARGALVGVSNVISHSLC